MTPKDRVLARWPDACKSRSGNIWRSFEYNEEDDEEGPLGDSWQSAANHPSVTAYWEERGIE